MHKMIAGALGAGLLGASLLAAAPAGAQSTTPDLTRLYPGERYSQYYYYGRPYYRRRYHNGGAAAAGVIGGLPAGALIGGAIASQEDQAGPLPKTQEPHFLAYCSRRYRTFDPIDGTFLARDGRRYMCEYP